MGRVNKKMRRVWRAAASFVLPKVPWALRKFAPKLTRPCTHAWLRSESSHQRALSGCYGGKISGSQQKVVMQQMPIWQKKNEKIDMYDSSRAWWFLACVAGAWKWWAQEKTGAREGDSPLACLPHARPFSLSLTSSKRLLRRLDGFSQEQNGSPWLFSHRLTMQMAISESSLSSKIVEIQKFGYDCDVTSHFSPPLSELQKCPYMSRDKSHNSFLLYF